jgi:hypothetical protein
MMGLKSQPGVTWITTDHPRVCNECRQSIYAGDRIAVYDDESISAASLTVLKRVHIKRIYCEECGHLLEDSLTTTESLA